LSLKGALIKLKQPWYRLDSFSFFQISFLALLYFVAGELSFAVSRENSIVTVVIFFAEGFALSGVLLFGRKMIVGIFLGQLWLTYGHMPLTAGLAISLVNSMEAFLGLWLFEYFKLDRKLSTTGDVFGLILLIALILQPFSSLLGNMVLFLFGMVEESEIWKSVFAWWFGNVLGQVLMVPTLLLIYAQWEKLEIIRLAGVGIFFAGLSYVLQVLSPISNVFLLLSVTFPLILYTSSRFGMAYGAFAMVVISVVTLYLSILGLGSFGGEGSVDNLINLNFYFLSQMLLLLTIGTLFEERKNREVELEREIAKALKQNQEQTLMLLQQSRLAQMGQVINMIAHQWRQPLNNLLLICEVLVYRYENNEINDEEIQRFQHDSTLQIRQMSKTIDDFRDFFQPRKAIERFELNRVLEDLILMVEPIFRLEHIDLEFKREQEVVIDGFPNEFSQAVLNIIYNAKDAFVGKSQDQKMVKIEIDQQEAVVVLSIWDNAGGIPEEIIEKIFNPYFSTKENLNGTGLGLYMSKMIIQTHMGGKLIAKNHAEGAVFIIELALAKEHL